MFVKYPLDDMLVKRINDPAKVVRSALDNTKSIAATLRTPETLITDMPTKGNPTPCRRCRNIKQQLGVNSQTKPCKGLQISARFSLACERTLPKQENAMSSGRSGLI